MSVELSQALITNTEWHSYDADWASNGLHLIAQVITELRGNDPNGGWNTLTSNSGEQEFINNIFEMRSYCWCDGGYEGHENGCPPNFLYRPSGLVITWYKHAARGITANKNYPGARNWFEIIKTCINSIDNA